MKDATAYAKKLQALLNKLKGSADDVARYDDPLDQLVYSFLLWETTARQADSAYTRLVKRVVDHNDLRVSDPAEIVAFIGNRYGRVDERAVRIRDSLHAIYLREHVMSLDQLKAMPKRDARAYLDELEGMVPFVSASIVLLSLGGHAIPVDEQMVRALKREQVVDEQADLPDVQGFLEHNIKASAGVKAFVRLRNLSEASGGGKTTKKTSKRSSKKKTAKKTTGKTSRKKSTSR